MGSAIGTSPVVRVCVGILVSQDVNAEEDTSGVYTHLKVCTNSHHRKILTIPSVQVLGLSNPPLPIVKLPEYVEFESASVRMRYTSVPLEISTILHVYDWLGRFEKRLSRVGFILNSSRVKLGRFPAH